MEPWRHLEQDDVISQTDFHNLTRTEIAVTGTEKAKTSYHQEKNTCKETRQAAVCVNVRPYVEAAQNAHENHHASRKVWRGASVANKAEQTPSKQRGSQSQQSNWLQGVEKLVWGEGQTQHPPATCGYARLATAERESSSRAHSLSLPRNRALRTPPTEVDDDTR